MTSNTSATGAILGRRYELLRKLGAGGMGEVYEARRIDLGDRVAIKLLREEDREDPELRERFLREARTLAQVASPHVVRIVDFMAAPGEVAFLVMELIVGQSVAELLRVRGPFSTRELGPIAMQMFAGLGAIHAVGLVHRDIKPQNLMIVDGGPLGPILKIVDFGLAKATACGRTSGYSLPSLFCGGACVPQDKSRCGGCTTTCAAAETCTDPVNGTWITKCADCPSRFAHAAICNNMCTNLDNNALNCGRCGNNCVMSEPACRAGGKACACQAGKCVSH